MVTIGKASVKDSGNIATLVQKYLGKDYRPFRITMELVEEKMRKKNIFFVARDRNRVIGTVRCSIVDVDLADLRWLIIEKSCSNKDIGTRMIDSTIRELRKKGIRKVIAREKAGSLDSMKILIGSGFCPEGYFREHYRKGTDIIQFARFLR